MARPKRKPTPKPIPIAVSGLRWIASPVSWIASVARSWARSYWRLAMCPTLSPRSLMFSRTSWTSDDWSFWWRLVLLPKKKWARDISSRQACLDAASKLRAPKRGANLYRKGGSADDCVPSSIWSRSTTTAGARRNVAWEVGDGVRGCGVASDASQSAIAADRAWGDSRMSVGTIILIILVIALLGGFSGIGGGPFYGTGYYGGGALGLVLAILLILLVLGKIWPARSPFSAQPSRHTGTRDPRRR